jgi:ketosteroid isomerase-like protein
MMNKILTTAVLFLFVQSAIAQKGIDNLIQAEKDFAAYSVAHSTKEAFQKFIDSNSIMFDNGKPFKAIAFWEKKEKNAGVLNWWPQYAEISASDDFGYTTGPWTFQPTKTDTVVARGQYITVWRINKNGEWKFLVDLGVSNTPANSIEDIRIIDTPKEPETYLGNLHPLAAAESDFNQMLAKEKAKAYKTWLSGESILTRNGFLPAATSAERRNIIDSTPAAIKYTMDGSGISIIPDMGYTYGTTVINGKTENYLHIWRRENSGWKIAVEVLRY